MTLTVMYSFNVTQCCKKINIQLSFKLSGEVFVEIMPMSFRRDVNINILRLNAILVEKNFSVFMEATKRKMPCAGCYCMSVC